MLGNINLIHMVYKTLNDVVLFLGQIWFLSLSLCVHINYQIITLAAILCHVLVATWVHSTYRFSIK